MKLIIYQRRIRILLFLLVIFVSKSGYAAFEEKIIGGKAGGFSGAYVASNGDAFSSYYNPATLRFIPGLTFGFYQTQLYGLSDKLYPVRVDAGSGLQVVSSVLPPGLSHRIDHQFFREHLHIQNQPG